MDHFLSGLDNHAAPWYTRNPVYSQGHEFAVGANAHQLIAISGAGIGTSNNSVMSSRASAACLNLSNSVPTTSEHSNPTSSLLALKASSAVNSVAAAVSAMGLPRIDSQIKEESEAPEERAINEMDGFPMNFSSKSAPKKQKNGTKQKCDMKKVCNLCGKVLSRGDKLKNHMRIHTNNFPFHCATCGQGFLRSEGLRIHTRIHTGERPYVCIVCGKSYTRKDKLTRHAIVHTGERPFVCSQCGKSFTRKDKLQRHELIHKVEKPWTCVPCNLEFGRQEGFNAHMERKHPERLPYTMVPHPRQSPASLISPSPEYLLAGTGLGPLGSTTLSPSGTPSGLHPAGQSKSPLPSTSRENAPPISIANKALAHVTSRLPQNTILQQRLEQP